MRTRRDALLLGLTVAAVSLALAGSALASAQPPGAGYVWAQPGTSLVGITIAEAGPSSAASMLPVAGYVWAQPGTSPAGTTTQALP